MRLLLTLFLLLPLTVGATTYTEFYVQTTGSNLNSGHTTDDAATYTGTGGNWTNNTSATTGTWFKSGESLAAVTNGAWAALYTDGTSTNAQFVGLITAVDDTADTVTISLQNYAGANPSSVVGGMTVKVGGAWKGMTTNTAANGGGFPLTFLSNTATNAQFVYPRCNIKSGTTYSIASTITMANTGPMRIQGYTTTVGDGGRFTLDGGTTGTSFGLITSSGSDMDFVDIILSNNGNSGSASLASISGALQNWVRVVAHDSFRSGFSVSGAGNNLVECEAYACNKNNSPTHGGFLCSGSSVALIRCISHDNTGSNGLGFNVSENQTLIGCIADSNGGDGFRLTASSGKNTRIISCDSYNNSGAGLDILTTAIQTAWIENCNFIKNGSNGVSSTTSSIRHGGLVNCGFGTGTATNALGNIASNIGIINESGTVLYAADQTPWIDPANGDFRISLTAAKSAGRGAFTQLAVNSPTNTISFPDIGAAQSASTNATATAGGSYTWSQ